MTFASSLGSGTGFIIGAGTLQSKAAVALAAHGVGSIALAAAIAVLAARMRGEHAHEENELNAV